LNLIVSVLVIRIECTPQCNVQLYKEEIMPNPKKTYESKFGTHCAMCGSLAEACGDVEQCHIDARPWIEEAILSGSNHPWLSTARNMFVETFPEKVQRSIRSRAATVQVRKIKAVKV